MALIDVSTITVPSHAEYSDTDPTKQQENLAYINEQLWEMMKQAGFVLTDNQMDQAEKDAFQALWNAQNDLIQQQSDYADEVAATFNTNKDKLPESSTFIDDLLWEFGEWLAGQIISYFFGEIWGEFAEIAVALLGIVLKTLDSLYTEGGELCNKIKAENDALLNLPFSKENYQIRSQIIAQHDGSLRTILTHILALEDQLQSGARPQQAQVGGEYSDLVDAVKDLRYNNEVVDFGAARLHLQGKVIEY